MENEVVRRLAVSSSGWLDVFGALNTMCRVVSENLPDVIPVVWRQNPAMPKVDVVANNLANRRLAIAKVDVADSDLAGGFELVIGPPLVGRATLRVAARGHPGAHWKS